MTIWRLILREITHRKIGFALGLLSVCIAVATLAGAMTLLRAHDLRTDQIVAAKEAETQREMAKMEDDYRKIMKDLGFNVLILPKDQNLADLYADDFASKYMPEEYVDRLAKSDIVTIQHLLPSLQQKARWPEQGDRTVIVIGTRGEVPYAQRTAKSPILEAVRPGTIVLGYELHRGAKVKEGDTIALMGRQFKVAKCHGERGNKDDITAWISLREAQEIFRRPGQINGILALECVCAADSLEKVRADIATILPDTQVIEFASQVIARAEARRRAAEAARAAIESEKRQRAKLRSEREAFAAVLVPIALVGCMAWIGLSTFGNVRDRRAEIGVLRALGVRSNQILAVFLGKAAVIGIAGGIAGCAAGFFAGTAWGDVGDIPSLFQPGLVVASVGLAPILALIAAWLPALLASQQDPAIVLREE
ncbi:MAG TPA: FtsX-like permease family protein [Verrucomicrobiae bacterium]|nr:FtsX-like permease family protein [Verrucomicrobiae bacterium]